MRYLITGGTGFIGQNLVNFLHAPDNKITILTRYPKKVPNFCQAIISLSDLDKNDEFDVIINLAGANISNRWTESYKKILFSSRLHITQGLVDFVAKTKTKPSVFINASAIGYYGDQPNGVIIDEDTKAIDSFTHYLCRDWEECARQVQAHGVNLSILRFGVVLGKNGGMLKKILPSFYFGFGGKIGHGQQILPWVHMKDVIGAIDYVIKNNLHGIYNVTALKAVNNEEFTKELAAILRRPSFLNLPARLVSLIFGEMGDTLLLKGNKVESTKLKESGFVFQFKTLKPALLDILK